MIDCADSTALRTHLDHPDPAVDEHLDECGTCPGLLRSVAEDAGFARRRLGLLDPPRDGDVDVDVEAALAAVLTQAAPAPVVPLAPRPDRRAGRRLLLSAAAALLVLVAVVTPTDTSAVASVLDAFRGERRQPGT